MKRRKFFESMAVCPLTETLLQAEKEGLIKTEKVQRRTIYLGLNGEVIGSTKSTVIKVLKK